MVALVSVDPVIRRSDAAGRDEGILVVAVIVEGVRVECSIVRGNGVEGSSDGACEIEIDDKTPSGAFCMKGRWCVEQLKLWVGFEDEGEQMEDWKRRRRWTYA